MRILYLANNRVGWQVLRFLKERGEEIVGAVLHPLSNQKYGLEIMQAAGLPEEKIFDASRLRAGETRAKIQALRPELGLSIFFGYILEGDFLSLFPRGVINLHPAFLPHNRGQFPNVWSIVEGTPAGATLHYMDSRIDTGDIITRKRLRVEPVDTGESLYHKLEDASLALFQEEWPRIRAGKAGRFHQDPGEGTFHYTGDVEKIDQIHLDQNYSARDLINIIRARTFPPHKGAYFESEGKRVYLRLELEYGDE